MNSSTIDFNPMFAQALDIMENTKRSVFITGRAGTGKSTLLSYFREHTKKNAVILAPTGVAAVNVKGQTIHSFFHFKPDVTVHKARKIKVSEQSSEMYRRLETIVIDEISMVRADVLDCVDVFLRQHGPQYGEAFGGVQMIFIGDLYQLPPVTTGDDKKIFTEHYTTPYFFSAHVFSMQQSSFLEGGFNSPLLTKEGAGGGSRTGINLDFIELQKIYRQKDADFIDMLSSVRNNTASAAHFSALNARLNPAFDPDPEEMYMYLTTTNAMAEEINVRKLAQLTTDSYFFRGQTHGKFEDKYFPTAPELEVKLGSQVMMLNNDLAGRWINGTMGQIVEVAEGGEDEPRAIMVRLESGDIEPVTPHRWDIYQFTLSKEGNRIESESVGSFTQYPLKLAWAVTIHKSQGKTFEKVIIDIGRGTFSSGQLYVALSRATTLEGIVLKKPISQNHIWLDKRVGEFLASLSSPQ